MFAKVLVLLFALYRAEEEEFEVLPNGKMAVGTFLSKLKRVANSYKTVYGWGTFGQPLSQNLINQKRNQYPSWWNANKCAQMQKLLGQGYFCFDCVGLIKGTLWGWNGDASKANGGASYGSNGVPDISADSMINYCSGVSTSFKNLVAGEALWMKGHIGVYIGQGMAIECTPAGSNNVQYSYVQMDKANSRTELDGLTRRWTKHGKLPYVQY
ncbi:putative mannosyl-glycoprotein endo-beta-N-acetylglucosaminidase [Monocercomonoides exilis]|uniref:putative mannosyl-glycoprotein endo-beta-N-acetylglucosaminidase n=1 Tax=Monocercomonoides exilis TaxID=2049356 RepID=UPI00355AAA49|nr:putative mannosyl-glycoprotein endo-beta-N-acetylglucosaminidase [Monocercomonoides exilis]|eukprot:MONOS_10908.1-p1 / transcript=MONOS_10908.1 / gene=MONOS_10908 / organism=Monocercomonoides_exilis_PA203 / gene_product=possible cell wall-binding protein / transcript_product=possible cell wall-binding protein / location=Mono_scaffold00517:21919-22554(-) / protein_length=211 / sequence_SO=supercontig / SO=protein_coding / is_pseudo=false